MNPYNVLGVTPHATPDEIKSAYRKLAMQHHPDRAGDSEEARLKFQEIQDAYDMVRSDKKQNQYSSHEGAANPFDDLFTHFFNQSRQPMNAQYQAHCEIALEDAFKGCTVSFNLPNGRSIMVDIPAGIQNGQHIRVKGAGACDDTSVPPGDLIVIVMVRGDAIFHRHGPHIITKLQIDLIDALVGCDREVTTIDGSLRKVLVPPNSAPGTTITLPGDGMTIQGSTNRGDHFVHLDIQFREFTPKELRALAKLRVPN